MVTPEAVPLELETAGLPSRMLARLIDSLIESAAGWPGAGQATKRTWMSYSGSTNRGASCWGK